MANLIDIKRLGALVLTQTFGAHTNNFSYQKFVFINRFQMYYMLAFSYENSFCVDVIKMTK